jgi:phytoene/squalene synthetase
MEPALSDAERQFYYVFIWDRQRDEMIASYCVLRGAAGIAGDVTLGAVPAAEEDVFTRQLQERYPIDRYTYGGGYAPSLDACVRAFFGLEKDLDHF